MKVTKDYRRDRLALASRGAESSALGSGFSWFPTKPSLAIKLHVLSDAGGLCGYFPHSGTSPSAFLSCHNAEELLSR